jgi:hypothetical protein
VAHHLKVAGEPVHKVAGGVFVEVVRVLPLDIVEEFVLYFENQTLRTDFIEHTGAKLHDDPQQRETHDAGAKRYQKAAPRRKVLGGLVVPDKRVDDCLAEGGGDDVHGLRDHRQAERENVSLAVTPEVFPKPFDLKHVLSFFSSGIDFTEYA